MSPATSPVYVISASVPAGNRVKRFHSERSDGARRLLVEAKQLRYAGFDLRMSASASAADDGAWEVKQGNRKNLRLYQDGTMIFRAAADDSFLGWGVKPETFQGYPRLNPVAVIEIHVGFVMLYSRILQQLEHPPREVLFQLTLRHVLIGSKRLLMTKHVPDSRSFAFDYPSYAAEIDPATAKVIVPAAQLIGAPWSVAYLLVEKFASFFDLPVELIPFVKEAHGVKEIDVEAIKNLS